MADCWRDGDNVALGAEIMMLPIDNFFWAAALWPDRVAVESPMLTDVIRLAMPRLPI